jgi:AraC-like DNA-binding protein
MSAALSLSNDSSTTASRFAVGYHESAPPAGLADWVECLWWRRVDGEERAEPGRILPDGRIDLVWTPAVGMLVAGPQTRFLTRPFAPPFIAVGARFHPGAGAAVLRVAASELRDAHIPLGALDAELASVLDDRLGTVQTAAEALTAFTTALARRCTDVDSPDPLVRAVVAALTHEGPRVSELAGAAAISERQLRRRFRASVGYGPKTLHRVLRFQRVVHELAGGTGRAGDLARCAAAAGYADQAHLTRECRELSGFTPGQVIQSLAA